MFSRYFIFLTMLLAGSFSSAAGEKLNILDTTGGGLALQEYFSGVFRGEKTPLPQELEINIVPVMWRDIEKLPANSVIADDGLTSSGVNMDLKRDVYAFLPVFVAVNKNNPLENLNITDLQRIFSGRVRDWARIGGKPGRIIIAGSKLDSPAGRIFRKLVMKQDLSEDQQENDITALVAPDLLICNTAEEAEALLQTSEAMIIFGGARLLENKLGKYKILKVENVFPDRKNIASKKYKLAAQHSILSSREKSPSGLPELMRFLRRSAADSAVVLPVNKK